MCVLFVGVVFVFGVVVCLFFCCFLLLWGEILFVGLFCFCFCVVGFFVVDVLCVFHGEFLRVLINFVRTVIERSFLVCSCQTLRQSQTH